MKRILILSIFALAIVLLPTGGMSAQSKQVGKTSPATQVATDCDPNGGADSYAGWGNNPRSHYYRHADYYNLCSNDTLLILPHFGTMQQTTEWSCGMPNFVWSIRMEAKKLTLPYGNKTL